MVASWWLVESDVATPGQDLQDELEEKAKELGKTRSPMNLEYWITGYRPRIKGWLLGKCPNYYISSCNSHHCRYMMQGLGTASKLDRSSRENLVSLAFNVATQTLQGYACCWWIGYCILHSNLFHQCNMRSWTLRLLRRMVSKGKVHTVQIVLRPWDSPGWVRQLFGNGPSKRING
jgi:hypothetical protein